jgi:hypothetical protein
MDCYELKPPNSEAVTKLVRMNSKKAMFRDLEHRFLFEEQLLAGAY